MTTAFSKCSVIPRLVRRRFVPFDVIQRVIHRSLRACPRDIPRYYRNTAHGSSWRRSLSSTMLAHASPWINELVAPAVAHGTSLLHASGCHDELESQSIAVRTQPVLLHKRHSDAVAALAAIQLRHRHARHTSTPVQRCCRIATVWNHCCSGHRHWVTTHSGRN